MHKNNNGDTSSIDNMMDFQKQISEKTGPRSIDLYTCDLGTDVSEDYNSQEIKHYILSMSQIVCGLMTLKPRGHMVVKLYTFFENFTISYISLLTALFEDVFISKPLTSKRTNSEVYVVCKFYKYPFLALSAEQKIYDLFIDRIRTKDLSPMVLPKYINRQIDDLYCSAKCIFRIQMESLKQYIDIMKSPDSISLKEKIKSDNYEIRKLFNEINILPINPNLQLIMRKTY